jgi:ATP-binding cassette, subfamily B, bacterial
MSLSQTPGLFEKAKGALHLGRALRLVWDAAAGWTVASALLVLLQAALPILALYLIKLVVDAVSAAASAPPGEADVQAVFVLLGLAGASPSAAWRSGEWPPGCARPRAFW